MTTGIIGYDVRCSWEAAALWAARAAGRSGYAWIQCLDSNSKPSTISWVLSNEAGLVEALDREGPVVVSIPEFENLPPSNRRIFPGYDVVYFFTAPPGTIRAPEFSLQNAAERFSAEFLTRHPRLRVEPSEVDAWMHANGVVSAVASAELRVVLFADAASAPAPATCPEGDVRPLARFGS